MTFHSALQFWLAKMVFDLTVGLGILLVAFVLVAIVAIAGRR